MTVRITLTEESGKSLLRVDGWLRAANLPELERLCAGQPDALALDLTELRGVDEPALALLRRLRAQGARLVGVSTYLALRLDGAAD